jgi:hypothetical protein
MTRSCPLCKRNPLTLFEDPRLDVAASGGGDGGGGGPAAVAPSGASASASASTCACASASSASACSASATDATDDGDMELVQLPPGNVTASPDSRDSSSSVDSAFVA